MITSSLHNHCTMCDGDATLEEMVRAAFEAGITDFGISCHADTPVESGEHIADERAYIAEVRRFIAENLYPIHVYLGTEEDFSQPVAARKE